MTEAAVCRDRAQAAIIVDMGVEWLATVVITALMLASCGADSAPITGPSTEGTTGTGASGSFGECIEADTAR